MAGFTFTHTKDPNAFYDVTIDWTDVLPEGDTIASSVWAIDDAPDAVLTLSADSFDDTSATVWLTAGTVDQSYRVRNRITTTAGRIFDRTIRVSIKDQ
jgi:hypothetical protein